MKYKSEVLYYSAIITYWCHEPVSLYDEKEKIFNNTFKIKRQNFISRIVFSSKETMGVDKFI